MGCRSPTTVCSRGFLPYSCLRSCLWAFGFFGVSVPGLVTSPRFFRFWGHDLFLFCLGSYLFLLLSRLCVFASPSACLLVCVSPVLVLLPLFPVVPVYALSLAVSWYMSLVQTCSPGLVTGPCPWAWCLVRTACLSAGAGRTACRTGRKAVFMAPEGRLTTDGRTY